VVEHPLDLADPDRDPGKLGGIWVDLDAEDRLRADARELLGDPEDERAPLNGLELEVLERPEGDVQEVARATGRIEDADRPETIEERPEEPEGLGIGSLLGTRIPAQGALGHLDLHRGVLAPEGPDDDRLHELPDVVAARVVGAELGPLRGVETTLEEGPEDRRLDPAPVQAADLDEHPDLGRGEAQDIGRVEQATVEPVDPLDPEHPAA